MTYNFMITQQGCPACREAKKVITVINRKLMGQGEINRMIHIIDNTSMETRGIKNDFVQDKLHDEDFTAYPMIYIEGFLFLGSGIPELFQNYLENLMEINR